MVNPGSSQARRRGSKTGRSRGPLRSAAAPRPKPSWWSRNSPTGRHGARRMRALCPLWRKSGGRSWTDRRPARRHRGRARPAGSAIGDAAGRRRATRSIAPSGISRPRAQRAARSELAGLPPPRPLITAFTISLGSPDAMAKPPRRPRRTSAAQDQARRRRRSRTHRRRARRGARTRNSSSMPMRDGTRTISPKILPPAPRRRHAGRAAAARRRR